jgi:hypothetical protein
VAFERRAAALERLVLALLARHQVALEHGQPLVPVPHALVAGDLLRAGRGAESGATPGALEALVHRLVEGKVLETPGRSCRLVELVALREVQARV